MDTNLKEIFERIAREYNKARMEQFGGHPLAAFIRRDIPEAVIKLSFINPESYIVAASGGKGNWANVPWISILNKEVTTTTESGYYLVYLFSEDMKRLYLAFSQGITNTPKELIPIIKQSIRNLPSIGNVAHIDDDIYLGESQKAKGYALATAAYIKYDLEYLPENQQLVNDLENMIGYYEQFFELRKNSSYDSTERSDVVFENGDNKYMTYKDLTSHIHSYIQSKGFYYSQEEVINLFLSLKSKPFVILSGISGTGKTKMAQWFAESVGANEENGQFALIPVRPDWSDSSDLLGYVDIKGEFKPGPLTKLIEHALDKDNWHLPHFVLLDEMNLARVEHYFSDILSVMESRKWKDGKLVTSTLLSKEVTGYDEDLTLPSNVYVIGTVNMDETTHPFSKKVLDRANTIEFNRVKLSNLAFLGDLEEVEAESVLDDSFRSKYLHLKDVYGEKKELVEKTTAFLEKINVILQPLNAHVGYRVRDEICFYMAYNDDGNLLTKEQALDHCILQKILPRIAGSDSRVKELLDNLFQLFTKKVISGDFVTDEEEARKSSYPNSSLKVLEMMRRLDDGFTSFWIS